MKINKILLLFFLSRFVDVQAQGEVSKKFKIKEFRVQTGLITTASNNESIDNFRKLAPQSELLKTMPDELTTNSSLPLNAKGMLAVTMGIQFRNKDKTGYNQNPVLRLGFGFVSGSIAQNSFNNFSQFTYDTLVSAQSGKTLFEDSVITTNYDLNYRSSILQFDGSLIFRTNPDNRTSIFSGFGLTSGISLNSITKINYYRMARSQYRDSNGDVLNNYNNTSQGWSVSERYRNEANYSFSAYIPLGIDFRLGNKRDFFKQTHLFFELRPGIHINNIPELETLVTAYLQQGIGVKVLW
jgi:hypothetical protein